jgi:hypothetical protein
LCRPFVPSSSEVSVTAFGKQVFRF